MEQVPAARLPAQLREPAVIPPRGGLRHERPDTGREVAQDQLFLPDDVPEQAEVEAIVDQRAADLSVHFPSARQFAPDLTGDQVGAVETVGLERGPDRALQHVPASQGDDLHQPALRSAHIRLGTEADAEEIKDTAVTQPLVVALSLLAQWMLAGYLGGAKTAAASVQIRAQGNSTGISSVPFQSLSSNVIAAAFKDN